MKKITTLVLFVAMAVFSAMAQWGNTAEESVLVWHSNINQKDIKMAPNGFSWVYYQIPADEKYSNLSAHVNLIDTLGNKVFGDEGLLVSQHPTRTWTTCNKYLFVDRDGNAIVAVHDIRNAVSTQYLSYTIYKISQTGEFLWGEDGIALEGTQAFPLSMHMTMTQVDNGDYVFAWAAAVDANSDRVVVKLQRMSQDGEMLWNIDEVSFKDPTGKTDYTWPTVIDAGLNQVIVIYFAGSNRDIYARKLDFDGTPVWSEDTRLYRQGWTGSPAWSVLDVKPSGDGGAILAWTDDRYMTGSSTYMTYVKSNGEIGFAAGVDGQKLSYSDYIGRQVTCMYDPNTDSFIAAWLEAYSSVAYAAKMQRLSKDGDLLWDEGGIELQPFSNYQYGYFSLQTAPNGEVAAFYMHNQTNFTNTQNLVTVFNPEDPTIRRDFIFSDTINTCEKSELLSTPMYDNRFWEVCWVDDYVDDPKLRVHRINADLTLGNNNDASVQSAMTQDLGFYVASQVAQDNTLFGVNLPQATQATLTIYDLSGAAVATPFNGELNEGTQYMEWNINVPAGVYLATLTTSYGVETIKVLVK